MLSLNCRGFDVVKKMSAAGDVGLPHSVVRRRRTEPVPVTADGVVQVLEALVS